MKKETTLLMLIICLLFYQRVCFSQKTHGIQKCSSAIIVDGNIVDSAWNRVKIISDFVQYEPYNSLSASEVTEVKITYDDNNIYLNAIMHDCCGDSVAHYLSARDEIGQADYFGIYIDPYNTGLTAYGFFVTAAGVQVDKKLNFETEDLNWDAVWKSAVKITANGWQLEMSIPYSALRIPNTENQIWQINIYRNIQRRREISTWNLIDPKIPGRSNQAGLLLGISDVKPPLRLSVMPYFSYYTQFAAKKIEGYQRNGGLDIKYGLSKSFTLDMMLIPDFNDIQTDDKILNLSSFETYYDEKRSFFTEGIEMFQRGGIFYSRRIGGTPVDYNQATNNLKDNEIVTNNPKVTQIINATKISGKTDKSLGIGFLNAMTTNSYAEITDTINGTKRKKQTNPFTNYNVFVVDKSLKNNSYVSLLNTNLSQTSSDYYANVTALDSRFATRNSKYSLTTKAAVSQIYDNQTRPETGYFYQIAVSKSSGNFRYSYSRRIYSENYNPNDMGYLAKNNLLYNVISASYNIYKPFWRLLYLKNSFSITHSKLHSNNKYISTQLNLVSYTSLKNHLSLGINLNFSPTESYDYFESRVANRVFTTPPSQNYSVWVSTNYSKIFAIDGNIGYYNSKNADFNIKGGWYSIAPRLRIGNKILIVYNFKQEMDFNGCGYFTKSNNADTIYFGQRDISTITNNIKVSYVFTHRSSLDFKLRHYWSIVNYEELFTLQKDGSLRSIAKNYKYLRDSDINYNSFNIDFIYNYQFAPGSELSLVWKNYIYTYGDNIAISYIKNIEQLFDNTHTNSMSVKIIFYMDYLNIKNLRKKSLN